MKTKHPKIGVPSCEHKPPKMMLPLQGQFRHQSRGLQQGRNKPR